MSNTILRLTGEQRDEVSPLRFDRREAVRRRLTSKVTALIVGAETRGQPRLFPLETLDISDVGVGAICEWPLESGIEVRLFFSPSGGEPGFELRGWVTRCVPCEGRYHVGLTFGRQSATAA